MPNKSKRLAVLMVPFGGGSLALLGCGKSPAPGPLPQKRPGDATKAGAAGGQKASAALPQTRFAPLGLKVGRKGPDGKPVTLACQTCHNHLARIPSTQAASSYSKFHAEIRLAHVPTCRTCHRAPTFQDFNLADGRAVPLGNVMKLCGQCHAKRLDEYLNGAHGGMRGFWDRSKGPQTRNHCIDCHDPHRPAIRQVLPAKRPNYQR